MRWTIFFLIYLTIPAALGPGVYSASNRNEYQKQKNVSGKQNEAGAYGWQPYRHLWLDCLDNVGSLASQDPTGIHGLLPG
jgi:hypothetical protein